MNTVAIWQVAIAMVLLLITIGTVAVRLSMKIQHLDDSKADRKEMTDTVAVLRTEINDGIEKVRKEVSDVADKQRVEFTKNTDNIFSLLNVIREDVASLKTFVTTNIIPDRRKG